MDEKIFRFFHIISRFAEMACIIRSQYHLEIWRIPLIEFY